MTETGDKQFGEIAIREKLLTPTQLDECLAAREALNRAGIRWTLPQVVQERGLLPRRDIRRVLELMQGGHRAVKLAGYEILEELGHGAMGTVYKARQIKLDRVVAIKVLSRAATADTKFVERFQREARAVASLRHKNVVAAFDFGEADGWYYMVMEMVEGLTLRKLVGRTGPLPEQQAIKIAIEIADALRHAHAKGIVHRDVKPGNIMLAADGTAKLCDLGMAKTAELGDPSTTRAGQTMGTPYYMAPEQARGETDIDLRADIYSLGATLFYVLTGDVPYKDPSSAVVMAKHLAAEIPWAKDINPKVSDAVARVVAKTMAKDRADRYQNCDHVIQDLKAVLTHGLLIAPPRERAPGVRQATAKESAPASTPAEVVRGVPVQGNRWTVAALGAALGLAVLLLLYSWWGAYRAGTKLDEALDTAFNQALRTAKLFPQERKENYKRFMQLRETAKGTRFEPLIDAEIQKLVPQAMTGGGQP